MRKTNRGHCWFKSPHYHKEAVKKTARNVSPQKILDLYQTQHGVPLSVQKTLDCTGLGYFMQLNASLLSLKTVIFLHLHQLYGDNETGLTSWPQRSFHVSHFTPSLE